MTDEEFVKSIYPDAEVIHVKLSEEDSFPYCILNKYNMIGYWGYSPAKAWESAKQKINCELINKLER